MRKLTPEEFQGWISEAQNFVGMADAGERTTSKYEMCLVILRLRDALAVSESRMTEYNLAELRAVMTDLVPTVNEIMGAVQAARQLRE